MSNQDEKLFPFENDIVFSTVLTEKPELAIELLKRCAEEELDGIDLSTLKIEHQKVCDPDLDAKSVRFDVCLYNEHGICDLEMQTSKQNLSMRTRYYASVYDVDVLKRGQTYVELPRTVIVFICTFDPFGLGYQKYKSKSRLFVDDACTHDVSELCKYDDECVKIFLNGGAYKHRNASPELDEFLEYLHTKVPSGPFTKILHNQVVTVNKTEKERIMTLQRRLDEERMVGFEQGIEQGIEQEKKNSVISFYSAGVPIDVIVTATNLSKEEVQAILAEKAKQD